MSETKCQTDAQTIMENTRQISEINICIDKLESSLDKLESALVKVLQFTVEGKMEEPTKPDHYIGDYISDFESEKYARWEFSEKCKRALYELDKDAFSECNVEDPGVAE